ncbi:MAG: hypothetical protein OEM02_02485 [Desulfobulbaceae bacterium]|nr:hypothetical protein [Desulfobulbaceae bacterium]
MKKSKIKKIAEKLGIKTKNMDKTDLIHAIQCDEGYKPCFQTEQESCEYLNCCWREDCLPASGTERIKVAKRDLYLKSIKTKAKKFKKNIEELKEKTKKMVGERKIEVLGEIKRLEKKGEKEIKLKMHEVSEASEDVWKKTKKGIDHSWDDLSKKFKKLSKKVHKHRENNNN